MKAIRKIIVGLSVAIASMAVVILLLEVVYRNQWIDFFSSEINWMNKSGELHSGKKKILVFGDSFSAQHGSYLQMLKDSLQDYTVLNCAIPGTSMREMHLFAEKRIAEYKPDKIVLQFYAGNDVLDISHPKNWREISLLRNFYWFAVDRIHSLWWLNYKLGALRTRLDSEQKFVTPSETETFNGENYNGRIQLLLKADKSFIEKSILLYDKEYETAFQTLMSYTKEIIDDFHAQNPNGKIFLVCIPHCLEVSETYKIDYLHLGAQLSEMNGREKKFYMQLQQQFPDCIFMNPLLALQGAEMSGVKTYFSNDDHLAPGGQKIVGLQLLQMIK